MEEENAQLREKLSFYERLGINLDPPKADNAAPNRRRKVKRNNSGL